MDDVEKDCLARGIPLVTVRINPDGSLSLRDDPEWDEREVAARLEAKRLRALPGRLEMEPFVHALAGREVIYGEGFFAIIRVAGVITNDFGFRAWAIPQYFLRFSSRRPIPTGKWDFSGSWEDVTLYGRESMSAGPCLWTILDLPSAVEEVRAAIVSDSAEAGELYSLLSGRQNWYTDTDLPPCPWTYPDQLPAAS